MDRFVTRNSSTSSSSSSNSYSSSRQQEIVIPETPPPPGIDFVIPETPPSKIKGNSNRKSLESVNLDLHDEDYFLSTLDDSIFDRDYNDSAKNPPISSLSDRFRRVSNNSTGKTDSAVRSKLVDCGRKAPTGEDLDWLPSFKKKIPSPVKKRPPESKETTILLLGDSPIASPPRKIRKVVPRSAENGTRLSSRSESLDELLMKDHNGTGIVIGSPQAKSSPVRDVTAASPHQASPVVVRSRRGVRRRALFLDDDEDGSEDDNDDEECEDGPNNYVEEDKEKKNKKEKEKEKEKEGRKRRRMDKAVSVNDLSSDIELSDKDDGEITNGKELETSEPKAPMEWVEADTSDLLPLEEMPQQLSESEELLLEEVKKASLKSWQRENGIEIDLDGDGAGAEIVVPDEDELEEVQEKMSEEETFMALLDSTLKKCEQLGLQLRRNAVSQASDLKQKQPVMLAHNLKKYQIAGVRWLQLLYSMKLSCILADEMGLGKTVQTIAALAGAMEKGDDGPHLVIVPNSTIEQWYREIEKWCPSLSVVIYHGSQSEKSDLQYTIKSILREMKDGKDPADAFHVIITTYSTIVIDRDLYFLTQIRFSYLVCDEAHNIKTFSSKRYKGLSRISCSHRLLLTGTPLQNNAQELFTILHFLMPTIFPSSKEFFKSVSKVLQIKRGKQEEDQQSVRSRIVDRIKTVLSPFMLRRVKQNVFSELPPKIEKVLGCEMPSIQKNMYESYLAKSKKEFVEKSDGEEDTNMPENHNEGSLHGTHTRFNFNNVMMELRKIANHPLLCRTFYSNEQIERMALILSNTYEYIDVKYEEVLASMQDCADFQLHITARDTPELAEFALSDDIVFESSAKLVKLKKLLKQLKRDGHRVLVFSQMTKVLDILEVFLEREKYDYCRLDGSTKTEERQEAIDIYQEDEEIFIFLLSTRAGGVGINLTAADTVIFYDTAFNYQIDRQAEDRCHRLGQTKEVTTYRLIAKDSIDVHIYNQAINKKQFADDILEDGASIITQDARNAKPSLKETQDLITQVLMSNGV